MALSPATQSQPSTGNASASTSQQWWADQWLELINQYRFKKRLERGWKYAREGNVLSIRFEHQQVIAIVQGTDPKPYKVSLGLDPLTDEDWEFVINLLSQRAIFPAKLLAGEMPPNIEDVFAASGLRLFPFQLSEVRSRCSCPDKANPCKHVSAVYYLLGDRFREDPFVIFQLRGRTRSQILAALQQKRLSPEADSAAPESPTPAADHRNPNVPEAPVATNLDRYWHYDQPLDSSLVVIAPPANGSTPLDILGPLPLPALGTCPPEQLVLQQQALEKALREVYQQMAQQAFLKGMGQ
ncbi:MAG: SWIM zinc finger family protein [Prochlorotrichaceae cyanobacterium]